MIDLAHLIAAGLAPTQARTFVQPLADACKRFDIDTPQRQGAFLAQCMVESVNFTHLEENLFYTDPLRIMRIFPSRVPTPTLAATLVRNPKALANMVYAGKNGNGTAASGDGFVFRGRGCFQLTGRSNYVDAQTALGTPYVVQPDLIAQPLDACLTAAWYWHTHKANLLADNAQFDLITRAINGPAMLDRSHRAALSATAISALA